MGDAEIKELMDEWQQWINEEAKSRGIYNDYLYLNYMGSTELSPYTSLPEHTMARLLDIQAVYDPESVFADLWKGGFKFSSTI